jgi:hypothetical protein
LDLKIGRECGVGDLAAKVDEPVGNLAIVLFGERVFLVNGDEGHLALKVEMFLVFVGFEEIVKGLGKGFDFFGIDAEGEEAFGAEGGLDLVGGEGVGEDSLTEGALVGHEETRKTLEGVGISKSEKLPASEGVFDGGVVFGDDEGGALAVVGDVDGDELVLWRWRDDACGAAEGEEVEEGEED